MDRREFIKNTALLGAGVTLASCGEGSALRTKGKNSESDDSMTFRENPKTGEKVSLLGFGMMRIPTQEGSSAKSNTDSPIDQEQVNRLVDRAIEAGVNYFDASPAYCKGLCERATGIALNRHPRDKWFVATKMSNFKEHSFEASRAMYENSFKELGVDYIDYYLLHYIGGGGMEQFNSRFIDNGILDFLLEERKAGRIRNLGFSYHGDIKVFDYLLDNHGSYHWDFVQIQMNYVDWENAKAMNPRNTNASYLYGRLEDLGIPAIVMEPLLGGRLASLPPSLEEDLMEREPHRSIPSWAFRFCGTYPNVLTILSGMTYMEHLEDNIKTFTPLCPLSEEELSFLQKKANVFANYPSIPCNQCRYCMPCPYGMDIPALFEHYNKCLNEGLIDPDSQNEEYRRLRRKFLASYTREFLPERQADKCIGCGQCVDKCPQRIDIPRKISRIDRYVDLLKRNKPE